MTPPTAPPTTELEDEDEDDEEVDERFEAGGDEEADAEPVHWLTVLNATSQPSGIVSILSAAPVQVLLLYEVMVAAVAEHDVDKEVPVPKAAHEVRGNVLYSQREFGLVAPFTAHVGLLS